FWIDAIGNQYFVGVRRRQKSQPGQAQAKDNELQKLLEERLATARDYAKLVTQRVKNHEGMPEELMEATRIVFEAELDLCASSKERVRVLEKFLLEAKENEKFLMRVSATGQGRQSTALKAKTERLQVEIALEQARAKAAPKSVQGNSAQESMRDEVAIAENQIAIKKAGLGVSEAQTTTETAKLATSKALAARRRPSAHSEKRRVRRCGDVLRPT